MNPKAPEGLLDHAEGLRALARGLLGDDHAADDVVQDTWITALARARRAGVPVRPWLRRVARNFALKRLRAEGRRRRHERAAPPRGTAPATDELVECLDLRRRVLAELRTLREPYRTTLILRFLEGRSAADIARAARISGATVRTRVRRGLDELRTRLDRTSGGRRAWQLALAPLLCPRAAAAQALAVGAKLKLAVAAAVVVVVGLLVWAPRSGGAGPRVVPPSPETGAGEESRRRTADVVGPVAPERAGGASATETTARGTLRVVVVDEASAPVPGATVQFRGAADRIIDARATDDRGATRLEVAGRGRLLLRHPRRAPRVVPDVAAPEGGEGIARVAMPVGLAIDGVVLRQDGKTPADAHVRAEPVAPPAWPAKFARSVRTRDGRFRLEGLPAGRYRLKVIPHDQHENPGVAPQPPEEADAGANDVVIVLASAVVLHVEIRDATTEAAVRAPMELRMVESDKERLWFTSTGGVEHRVAVAHAPRLRFRVLANGYAPSEIVEVTLLSGQRDARLRLSLMPDPGGMARLRLVVRDDLGRTVPRVLLMRGLGYPLSGWVGNDLETPVPEDGALLPLRPGRHAFRLRPPHDAREDPYLEERVDVEVQRGETVTREVVLRRGGWVRFRTTTRFVSPPMLEPVAGGDPVMLGRRREGDGHETRRPVPPGTYRLKGPLPGGRTFEREVAVTAEQTTEVRD